MKKNVKITILKSEVAHEPAFERSAPGFRRLGVPL